MSILESSEQQFPEPHTAEIQSSYLDLPRGFRDWDQGWLEREHFVYTILAERGQQIGCQIVRTAPLSFASTFQRGIHTTGEKVFTFQDRRGRRLMLPPDSTPAVMRWYLRNHENLVPARIIFDSPIFRYRQGGRFNFLLGFALINEGEHIFNRIDEGSLSLARTMLKVIVQDLGVTSTLCVGDFGLIRRVLQMTGTSKTAATDILHALQPLSKEERRTWIATHLPSGQYREMFVSLLELRFVIEDTDLAHLCLDNDELKNLIVPVVQFARESVAGFPAACMVAFDDLHSSELQDGICFSLFTPDGRRLCDGGCYRLFGAQFDSRIHSLKSVATSSRSLVRRQTTFSPSKRRPKVLVVSIDASTSFTCNIIERLISIDGAVTQQRLNGKLKLVIRQAAKTFDYLIVLGKSEEDTGQVSVRNLQTGVAQEIAVDNLVNLFL